MGGEWFRDDTGFTEEERALIGMRECREAEDQAKPPAAEEDTPCGTR